MCAAESRKMKTPNIFPSGPCSLQHKPPIDIIRCMSWSDGDVTSDDDEHWLNFENLRVKLHEKKEDIKRCLGLSGSFREGKYIVY